MIASDMTKERRIRLAYAAGIVDGEGSLGLYPHQDRKCGYESYVVVVKVKMTTPEAPRLLYQLFGGGLHLEEHKGTALRAAIEVMTALRPFLLEKRKQADHIIAFVRTRTNPRNYHVTEAERAVRADELTTAVAELRAMKREDFSAMTLADLGFVHRPRHQNRLTLRCKHCDGSFTIGPWRLKKPGQGQFCSAACQYADRSVRTSEVGSERCRISRGPSTSPRAPTRTTNYQNRCILRQSRSPTSSSTSI